MFHQRFHKIRLTWCKESFVVPTGNMALSGSFETTVHNLRHNMTLITAVRVSCEKSTAGLCPKS